MLSNESPLGRTAGCGRVGCTGGAAPNPSCDECVCFEKRELLEQLMQVKRPASATMDLRQRLDVRASFATSRPFVSPVASRLSTRTPTAHDMLMAAAAAASDDDDVAPQRFGACLDGAPRAGESAPPLDDALPPTPCATVSVASGAGCSSALPAAGAGALPPLARPALMLRPVPGSAAVMTADAPRATRLFENEPLPGAFEIQHESTALSSSSAAALSSAPLSSSAPKRPPSIEGSSASFKLKRGRAVATDDVLMDETGAEEG